MKNQRYLIYFLFLGLLATTSCVSRKNVTYFNPDGSELATEFKDHQPKIQIGDVLQIGVLAADPKTVAAFNLAGAEGVPTTYTVDNTGSILYPQLGRIKLAGLTRLEAIDFIKEQLKPYVVESDVNIVFTNFKVTVVGDVANPGTFNSPTDRITIIDALAMAGDMQTTGIRNNVLLVREENGVKTMVRIDLTKQETLNSPYYYLAQNDMIYVEPNRTRLNLNSGVRETAAIVTSLTSIVLVVFNIFK